MAAPIRGECGVNFPFRDNLVDKVENTEEYCLYEIGVCDKLMKRGPGACPRNER